MHADLQTVLLVAGATMLAENLGPKECRKRGVGKFTEVLKRGLPENGIGPAMAARRQAVQLLRSHCRLCGMCDMARH